MTNELPLGRDVAYPTHYDPSLLFPIPRANARSEIGVDGALPFTGHDRWHAYELSWLGPRGKPCVATATATVPADSPQLIESKSFKLYLNSFNAHRMDSADALRATIERDLSQAAGAPVQVAFGLPPSENRHDGAERLDATLGASSLDTLDIAIEDYGPPNPSYLHASGDVVAEALSSSLLKSNCPVTGQPDWAELDIAYRGPRIDKEGLLRYLVSFRDHAEFHEQCVERIFCDVLARCAPVQLSVEARYTRRGGLDINPWRATPGLPAPKATRTERQ